MPANAHYHVDRLGNEDVLCMRHAVATLPPEARAHIDLDNIGAVHLGGQWSEQFTPCTAGCTRCYVCEEQPKALQVAPR